MSKISTKLESFLIALENKNSKLSKPTKIKLPILSTIVFFLVIAEFNPPKYMIIIYAIAIVLNWIFEIINLAIWVKKMIK